MEIVEKIEQSLGKATSIQFFPTEDYARSPSVIVLVFNEPEVVFGYNLLFENFKKVNKTITFFPKNNKMDISISFNNSERVISIKDLFFKETELNEFIQTEQSEGEFIFAIGQIKDNQLILINTQERFTPVIINNYKLIF